MNGLSTFFNIKSAEMRYNYSKHFMEDSLILQDKNYISARRVHELFGYTSDYVGQLCRTGKLDCKMIGRSWFVTEKSIIDHKSTIQEIVKSKTKEKRRIAKKVYQSFVATVKAPTLTVSEVSTITSIVSVSPIQSFDTQLLLSAPQHSLLSVPTSFALPYFVNESFLFSRFEKPNTLFSLNNTSLIFAAGICVVSLFFVFQSVNRDSVITANISNNQVTASIISSSQRIIAKTVAFFSAIPQLAINTFKQDQNTTNINYKSNLGDNSQKDFNGLAVVPSSNSPEKDEVIKSKIRESFSDEVAVKPDSSGTAGIITPVFRKAKGDDFVYVLVPVKNQ